MNDYLRGLARRFIRAEAESLRSHKAVLRLLSGVKASSLLDVGCADGSKAEQYAGRLGIKPAAVAGVETNREYSKAAEKKFKVYIADLEKERLPLPDESFDLIVCNQVLEHLKNIYGPLQEMDRVVKTGGHLLIGVPNLAGLYNRALLLLGKQPLCSVIDGPHVRSFAHSAMLEFLSRNGNFTVAACGGANLYPLPWPLLDLSVGRFPGLSAYSFYLLEKVRHAPADCAWKPGPAGDTVFG
jgi:ubiquinone/menaquinone biosynthesis C-methylase UbiE